MIDPGGGCEPGTQAVFMANKTGSAVLAMRCRAGGHERWPRLRRAGLSGDTTDLAGSALVGERVHRLVDGHAVAQGNAGRGAEPRLPPAQARSAKTVHRRFQQWCEREVLREVLTQLANTLREQGWHSCYRRSHCGLPALCLVTLAAFSPRLRIGFRTTFDERSSFGRAVVSEPCQETDSDSSDGAVGPRSVTRSRNRSRRGSCAKATLKRR